MNLGSSWNQRTLDYGVAMLSTNPAQPACSLQPCFLRKVLDVLVRTLTLHPPNSPSTNTRSLSLSFVVNNAQPSQNAKFSNASNRLASYTCTSALMPAEVHRACTAAMTYLAAVTGFVPVFGHFCCNGGCRLAHGSGIKL